MPARIPSHLISPDGIRVPIHGAVDAVNLRSRGYRDLTPHEEAQLAVELAELNLTHAQREQGDSGQAVAAAELALAQARADAARQLQEMNDELARTSDSDRATAEAVAAAAAETPPPAPEPETTTAPAPAPKASRGAKPAGK